MRGFFLSMLVVALLLVGSFAVAELAEAPPEMVLPEIQAKAAVLIERTSGRILYQKNANDILPIASTTKVMTALLAIEHGRLDEVVTASKNASGVPGTSIYLGVGEQLSMRNMLYGLMLRSGNDAAVAIAEHIDGSVQAFAEHMNARAKMLGADANFVTPNGLDQDGHGASALGMARIAAKALEYQTFREIVGTKKATIPWPGNPYDRVLENKNRLLRDLEGATGVKTGFTSKAGRCLVFSAEREGMELVGVVLNCGTWFESASELTNWGFETYQAQRLFYKGDVANDVRVKGGMDQTVEALYAQALTLPCSSGEKPMILLEMSAPLSAPILEGEKIGRAIVTINGKTECIVDLLAANDVEQRTFMSAMHKVLLHFVRLFTGRG